MYADGRVVHSEGRLILHNFPITDLQKDLKSYLIRVGVAGYRLACAVSRTPPSPWFNSHNGTLDNGGLTQRRSMRTTWLSVNTTNIVTFQNRDVYCDDMRTNYFYLYLTSSNSSECVGSEPCVQNMMLLVASIASFGSF